MLDKDAYTDGLKEIMTIGAGHAASKLSQILSTKVGIDLPRSWLGSVGEDRFSGWGKAVGLINRFGVSKKGSILQIYSQAALNYILRRVLQQEFSEFGEMEKSALAETANIIAGGLVSAVAELLGEVLSMDAPIMKIDVPISLIKYIAEEQRSLLGWNCIAVANLNPEGLNGTIAICLLPYFDIMKSIWGKI
jgi:chemotaxis protein CheY-P-specific phosphatase CheC